MLTFFFTLDERLHGSDQHVEENDSASVSRYHKVYYIIIFKVKHLNLRQYWRYSNVS